MNRNAGDLSKIRLLMVLSGLLFGRTSSQADAWTENISNYAYINSNNVNVGIGTSSPSAPFMIRRDFGTSTQGEKNWVYLEQSPSGPSFSIGYRVEGTTPSRVFLGTGNNKPLDFRTSGKTQAMTLLDNGNFGIGITNPAGPLDVRGGTASSGAGQPIILSGQQGSANNVGGNVLINSGPNGTGSTNGDILFGTGGTLNSNGTFASGEKMRIYGSGNISFTNNLTTGLTASGGLAPNIPNNNTPLYIRRIVGTMAGEHNWVTLDYNGQNSYGGGDASLVMGYRIEGTLPTRTFLGAGNSFPLDFRVSGNSQAMTILNNGNVGIGNPNPAKKVHVSGDVQVDGEVAVTSIRTKTWTVGPDYVFEKDYKLASLDEVDSFVKKNKHLPEVPSAKAFKEEGMDLGEMNFLLLKKVEELTLHAIQQGKHVKAQEARIAELEKRISGRK